MVQVIVYSDSTRDSTVFGESHDSTSDLLYYTYVHDNVNKVSEMF